MEGIWYRRGTSLCGCVTEREREIQWQSSVHVAQVADWLILHDAQVVHGAAEGNLDSLADAGCASFHHFDLVDGLVHAQRDHLGSRKPLPEGGGEKNRHLLQHLHISSSKAPSRVFTRKIFYFSPARSKTPLIKALQKLSTV